MGIDVLWECERFGERDSKGFATKCRTWPSSIFHIKKKFFFFLLETNSGVAYKAGGGPAIVSQQGGYGPKTDQPVNVRV